MRGYVIIIVILRFLTGETVILLLSLSYINEDIELLCMSDCYFAFFYLKFVIVIGHYILENKFLYSGYEVITIIRSVLYF